MKRSTVAALNLLTAVLWVVNAILLPGTALKVLCSALVLVYLELAYLGYTTR